MYNEFFGLRKSPFNMAPDPEFLYLTRQYREALVGLTYAVLGRKGFVVLTGDVGTGKTTLMARSLRLFLLSQIQTSVIVNPTLTPSEFLEAVLLDFGLEDVPASKPRRLAKLSDFLVRGQREGKISALIIDEAHKLSPEVIEEIRLLGNFELHGEKLLQVALLGQKELEELLDREQLRQFKQRIAVWLSIRPLSGAGVEQYIRHRWTKAGGTLPPFSAEAFARIAEVSQGIPRVINVICDNALLLAFGEESSAVELHHVQGVCADLRLAAGSRLPQMPAAAPAPPVPAGVDGIAMKTLERYNSAAARPSFMVRLASKLGLVHRIETA